MGQNESSFKWRHAAIALPVFFFLFCPSCRHSIDRRDEVAPPPSLLLPPIAAVVVVARRSRVSTGSFEYFRRGSTPSRELLGLAGGGVCRGGVDDGGKRIEGYLSVPTTRDDRDSRDSGTLSVR